MRALLLAIAMVAMPTSALAEELADLRSVEIVLQGSIREHCAMGNIADMDFGNLERQGIGRETRVAFDCNLPFTMMIRGERGSLKHLSMPNGQGPYGGAVPYSLAIEMPVRHPASEMVSRTFGGDELLAGGVITSNGGIATDGMVLAVQLGRPMGGAGLLAGNYTETITITVNPM